MQETSKPSWHWNRLRELDVSSRPRSHAGAATWRGPRLARKAGVLSTGGKNPPPPACHARSPNLRGRLPDAAGRRRTPESRLAGQRPSFSASLRMSCRPRTARLAASEACACEAWSSLPSFDRSLNIRHCASAGIRLRVSYSPTANHITYNPFSRAKAAENPPGLFGENAQFRCKVKPLGDAP